MTYNQEIIPDELLVSLAAQREGIPFPTGLEVLIFVIVFEILREADLRSPKITGSAISIVGALILGDAAVAAGLVSPIVIIIVAITSISELVFYDIDMISAVREWRVIFIIASLLMGLIGVFVALFIFIIRLVSIETLGIPYLTPITPDYIKQWKDIIYRMPIRKLKDRPKFLTKNTKRMGSNEKGSI
jgi:spore germination protein KA